MTPIETALAETAIDATLDALAEARAQLDAEKAAHAETRALLRAEQAASSSEEERQRAETAEAEVRHLHRECGAMAVDLAATFARAEAAERKAFFAQLDDSKRDELAQALLDVASSTARAEAAERLAATAAEHRFAPDAYGGAPDVYGGACLRCGGRYPFEAAKKSTPVGAMECEPPCSHCGDPVGPRQGCRCGRNGLVTP